MDENRKMRHAKTIPEMKRGGAGGIKENDGGDEFNCDTL
jgi:hypothetical protein